MHKTIHNPYTRIYLVLFLMAAPSWLNNAFSQPLMDESHLYNYCQESQRYYPDVMECPGGWIKVSPSLLNDQPIVYINSYPNLVQIPQFPVYYDPYSSINYFFYGGAYWLFINEMWYSSTWFNGPWYYVSPDYIPLYLLRVPIRYYRQPPRHFLTWDMNSHPHWGEYWGREWEDRHRNWNQWDKKFTPRPAPLPLYQKQYMGERYPRDPDEQQLIHTRNYNYQSKESKHFEKNVETGNPIEFKRDVFIPQEYITPQIREARPPQDAEKMPRPFNPPMREFQQPPPSTPRFQNQNTQPIRSQPGLRQGPNKH